MIFRELNQAEVQILKLIKMHLILDHLKLAGYMEMGAVELHTPIKHLEREGLISVEDKGHGNIYCPTALGLSLVRETRWWYAKKAEDNG